MVITTTFREGARRVIGATAKPLYAIDGKAEGLDRRTLQTSLLEGGGPPAGGGRSKRIACPSTFRVLSKTFIQPRVQGRNPARFNGGYGVPRGFKGEKSKSPPNPLGLAERVYSFHRPRGGPPPSKREVLGFRRSRPPALPSITYRGFAVAPITLRAPSRRVVVITSGTNGRAMRAPTGYGDAAVGCKCI